MIARQRTPYPLLEVVRLGRAEWRVSEASEDAALLGFIERQRRDRFEILWMSDPLRWGYAPSFDSALLAFVDASRFAGEVSDERARWNRAPRLLQRTSVLSGSAYRSTWSGDTSDN